ncbi:MAG: sulfate ABC transporter permease subunit CysT [Alphaproteobacteria bacterium]|nr:sulfate ABC transporter permease subunit CysT [Alphaproteobacteria bacterium]
MAGVAASPKRWRFREPSALGGFWPSFGFVALYLGFIVLIPLAALALRPWEIGIDGVWRAVSSERTVAALKLSFGAAAIAASVNAVFGTIVAWALVRYEFPGRRVIDALVDLPFALPTAVAGIALAAIYAPNGFIGAAFAEHQIRIAYTPIGIMIALVFIGFPFVVRAVQPVLADLERDVEEAAATLGASRWRTISQVIWPSIAPAMLTGFSLAFARAVGEYGSVIFIAGNLPMVSEIAPLLIIIKLEEFDYAGAAAIGLAMLVISFVLLFVLNGLHAFMTRRGGA